MSELRTVQKDRLFQGHPIGVRHCYHCDLDGPHRLVLEGVAGFKVGECCGRYDDEDRISDQWVARMLAEVGRKR